MSESPLFSNHDDLTPVNWAKVWEALNVDNPQFDHHQLVLIAVLEFLCGSEMAEVSLDEVAALPELDRLAVIDALRTKWASVELQENL
jgi:hypothetical protein